MSKILTVALALAVVTVAGCSEPAAQPVAPPPSPAPTGKVVKPIPDATMKRIKSMFDEAGKLAQQAETLQKQGVELARTGGPEAANDVYLKARRLYREAAAMTEEVVEPDLGMVDKDQIEAFLRPYVNERAGWMKKSAEMGKLHD